VFDVRQINSSPILLSNKYQMKMITGSCGNTHDDNGTFLLKGTVARDFRPLVFHGSTPYGPLIHTIEYFQILF
jgi:hypothetical protein